MPGYLADPLGPLTIRWSYLPRLLPWLLRFFDQIRFFPVSAEELLDMRARMPHGAYEVDIEDGAFSLKDYQSFLDHNAMEISHFRQHQRAQYAGPAS